MSGLFVNQRKKNCNKKEVRLQKAEERRLKMAKKEAEENEREMIRRQEAEKKRVEREKRMNGAVEKSLELSVA